MQVDLAPQPSAAAKNLGRAMIEAQVQPTRNGAIIFDVRRIPHVDEAWFEPAQASRVDASATRVAGRGAITFFDTPFAACVLRHYRRGGLVATINSDRYLFTGRARTRGFREFRLLARLHAAGLRVPAPLFARYVRSGLMYRADLVTERIPGGRTLADHLATGTLDVALAERVGRAIGEMHVLKVWHADLNAHNVLTDSAGEVWLLDFDRSEFRKSKPQWRQANLDRLYRSFLKLRARQLMPDFDAKFWSQLLAAYHRLIADRYARGDV
jgi:3-deoxy-D-manno-octulosonic acid kinase